MTYTIKDYYKRHRAAGVPASKALYFARLQHTGGKISPWDIKNPAKIEYNPETETGGRWIEAASAGLRFVGYADELATRGIQHKGWYTDEDGIGDTLRGVVYALPARKGQRVFAYGYADPCNEGCAYLVFDTRYNDDETGAAYAADRIAEKHAEREREYNEAWRAGSDYADAGETIKRERRQCLGLLAAMRIEKARGAAPAICDVLRSQVQRHIAAIQQARREREKLKDDFSAAWRKDTYSAFNDGAGETVLA